MRLFHWQRLLSAGIALTLAWGLGGCASSRYSDPAATLPAPKADPRVDRSKLSRELNVFNWTEYLPAKVVRDFERLYGVKVNYDTFSSNEEMHAKLKAGGSGYDLVFPSDYMVQVLVREHLLEPLNRESLPNLSNLDPAFLGLPFDAKNEFTVPYMWGTTGIAVNTEHIAEGTLTRWNDLWRPEFRAKLVVLDDARETIGVALRAQGLSLNTRDRAALEQAKAKLRSLKPNIKAFNSDSAKDMLLGGEVAAGVMWSGEAARAIQENPKIRYVLPAEGATRWMDNMAIPKGSQNRYTAEVFINFLLDPSVSARLSLAYPYGNPNRAARQYLPKELMENPAINPPAEALARAQWLEDLGDEYNQVYDRIWTELKGD